MFLGISFVRFEFPFISELPIFCGIVQGPYGMHCSVIKVHVCPLKASLCILSPIKVGVNTFFSLFFILFFLHFFVTFPVDNMPDFHVFFRFFTCFPLSFPLIYTFVHSFEECCQPQKGEFFHGFLQGSSVPTFILNQILNSNLFY